MTTLIEYLDRYPRNMTNISKKMTIHIENAQLNFSQSSMQLGIFEKYWYVVGMQQFWYTDGV